MSRPCLRYLRYHRVGLIWTTEITKEETMAVKKGTAKKKAPAKKKAVAKKAPAKKKTAVKKAP